MNVKHRSGSGDGMQEDNVRDPVNGTDGRGMRNVVRLAALPAPSHYRERKYSSELCRPLSRHGTLHLGPS